MDQIWSLLNSLQVVEYVDLLEVQVPGNLGSFRETLSTLSSIDVLDFEEIVANYIYVPEMELASLNFFAAGYSTNLFIVNCFSFLMTIVLLMCLIPLLIFLKIVGICCKKAAKWSGKLRDYLVFGGPIRLFIEIYLNLCIMALLNIYEMSLDSKLLLVKASSIFAIAFICICAFIPAILLLIACLRRKSWHTKTFRKRYGSFLEGTD